MGDGGGIRWWLLWRVALVQLVATGGGVHIFMAVFGMAQPEFRQIGTIINFPAHF